MNDFSKLVGLLRTSINDLVVLRDRLKKLRRFVEAENKIGSMMDLNYVLEELKQLEALIGE